MTPPLSRRSVLAGTGVAGALALGWRTARADPTFTHYTYAQTVDGDTDDRRLMVAWYETYNGEFRSAQSGSTEANVTAALDPNGAPGYVDESTGPVVTLGNLLPGDTGTLVLGILAAELDDSQEGLDVWFRTQITRNDENGITEPERMEPAEDDPGDGSSRGELADALEVRMWLDDGILGACDGRFGLDESAIATGTAETAFGELSGGVRVATCLSQGRRRCIGLEWTLPVAVGNVAQTDSLEFDLAFVGQPCGEANPFAEAER